MSEHTKGPWGCCPYGNENYEIQGSLQRGQHCYSLAIVKQGVNTKDEAFANARLIAAAPDLLTAAEDALSAINYLLGNRQPDLPVQIAKNAVHVLTAAIAKAKGDIPKGDRP